MRNHKLENQNLTSLAHSIEVCLSLGNLNPQGMQEHNVSVCWSVRREQLLSVHVCMSGVYALVRFSYSDLLQWTSKYNL